MVRTRNFSLVVSMLFLLLCLSVWAAPNPREYFQVTYRGYNCKTFYKAYAKMIILWNPNGPKNPVNIDLVTAKTHSRVVTIAHNLKTYGIYQWSIPASIPSGDYKIMVTKVLPTGSGNPKYGLTHSFKITAVQPNSIIVTYPDSHCRSWYKGSTYAVRWQPDCGLSNTSVLVDIYLVSEDGTRRVLLKSGLNIYAGSVRGPSVTIPSSTPDGRYKIRIESQDGGFWGESVVFSVVSPPSIRITNPSSGALLFLGRKYRISWNTTSIPSSARIRIFLKGGSSQALLYSGTNTGHFDWSINPVKIKSGTYRILIESPDFSGVSDEISVTIKNLSIRNGKWFKQHVK